MDSQITVVRGEDAAHCDGAVCGQLFIVDDEEVEPGPHHHLLLRGVHPATSARYVAICRYVAIFPC
jgi:hypothetical protein